MQDFPLQFMKFEAHSTFAKLKKQFILLLLLLAFIALSSCSIINSMMGVNFNNEDFALYREAKITSLRLSKTKELEKKLTNQTKSDIEVILSYDMLKKVLSQYIGANGYLDEATSYTISDMKLTLHNGSGISSLYIKANNKAYGVDVDLIMDCLLSFELKDTVLLTSIEPFNISPIVKTGTLLSSTQDLIERLIKMNLATISDSYPPVTLPLTFKQSFILNKQKTEIRNTINMDISLNSSKVDYNIKLKDIFIFNNQVKLFIDIDNVEVK